MNESFPRLLKSWARVHSTKVLTLPKSAITHIQKIAPGPPTTMAVATPARLPVPTLEARDTIKASKVLTRFSPEPCLPLSPLKSSLNICPSIVNWTPFVLMVNQMPAAERTITITVAIGALMEFRKSAIDFCIWEGLLTIKRFRYLFQRQM